MKVCWLSSLTSPYKMYLYELIGKEVDLISIIDNRRIYKRYPGWDSYNSTNFKLIEITNNNFFSLAKQIKNCDLFVNSMYSTKLGIFSLFLAKLFCKTTALHADGGIAKNRNFFKKRLIKFLMTNHNYLISSGPTTDDYFNYFVNGKKRIFHYNFSSLSQKEINENNVMSKNKSSLKDELLRNNNFTYISVGRPIYRKGFDILLKAFAKSELNDKCNLLIVGGEPEENIIALKNSLNLYNVTFIESKSSEELKKYYACSDAFILCTREDVWGLVINEAISFNLPFITSDQCMAGLHFNKMHGIGKIVKNEDIDGFSEALRDSYLPYSNNDYYDVSSQYSIEMTSKNILDAFKEITNISNYEI